MNIKDLTPVGLSKIAANNQEAMKTLGELAAVASWSVNKNKRDNTTSKESDPFSLSAFQAKLRDDGWRLAKNYYFNVIFSLKTHKGPADKIVPIFKFAVDKIALPGWRARTQQNKIYGLMYETAVELEQDPIWVTFNVDINHEMSNLFFDILKNDMFSNKGFSPKYKDDVSFEMAINVTDENFKPLYEYTFHNSIFKTIQQINMGQGSSDFTQIVAEIVYENIDTTDFNTTRPIEKPNESVSNKNKLPFGPFDVDISAVNQAVDTVTGIPKWFDKPIKI